jgi:vacuolar protein sorting-associated protein IST1
MKKMIVEMPSAELVDAYLREIAKGYNVPWTPPGSTSDEQDDTGGDGGIKVCGPPKCVLH